LRARYLVQGLQAALDGILDVLQCLLNGCVLGMAARERWAVGYIARLFAGLKDDLESQDSRPS
jgi:hypothetical protein